MVQVCEGNHHITQQEGKEIRDDKTDRAYSESTVGWLYEY